MHNTPDSFHSPERRKRFLRKIDRRYRWLAAGLFCFALFPILSYFPWFTEKYYSRGFFVAVRYVYDFTVGLTALPATYPLGAILLVYIAWKIHRYIRFNLVHSELPFRNRLGYGVLSVGSFLGKISVVFFLGYGYNYWRTPIEDIAGIEATPLTPEELMSQIHWERKRALEARNQIQGLGDQPFHNNLLPSRPALEQEMRTHLNKVMQYLGYPAYNGIRCKFVNSDYFLKVFGYTGVYISFFGEAQVNGNLAPVYVPFVVAHEMAHAYGFFDEATANFLAYLACEQSENPAIQYSGRISHLLYLWGEMKFGKMNFPKLIKTDLQSNGAITGEAWYARMIVLVNGWRKKHPVRLP